MNQDCPDAGDLSGLDYAQDSIAKQPRANAQAMKGFIDCEAPQDDHRNRIGHVAPDSSRRPGVGDGARRERVIADDLPANTDYEGSGGSTRFIPVRTAAEPVVQCRLTGIESREIVVN